ncbi:mpv17-like protein isoform X2 [Aphidius gifuensis]|uniref:mpv17-like protein isoform X2 n=1 Tax=Aphidius gifuensis TaxID=684658 RepID=UPI001CDCA705|nr:mpv17-like protein isoform X2 [Aphidius gifuensis]XP_044003920.1 mpv17-like protein isoform X2 [Aphidius gifuensis]
MSMSRQIFAFFKGKPIIINSMVYGSFYICAEFLQQTYQQREIAQNLMLENTNSRMPSGTLKIKHYETNENEKIDIMKILENYDWQVIQRYILYGYFMAGPILHTWYVWLDRTFVGKASRVILRKLLCDQFILTPPLLVLFFTSMSLMEGKDNIAAECKEKFVRTFQTSCMFWLPVQFVNFLLIPPSYRVAFVSAASFLWVNILCYLKRTPTITEE